MISDLEALALTIYGEARGEPIEGQIAVASVIRNRITDKTSYYQVCLAKNQFSCWNPQDPNKVILDEMIQQMIAGQVINDLQFNQCLWIAQGTIKGSLMDNTKGAKNYLTSRLYDSTSVSWAKNPIHPIKIGNQVFFNV